MMNRSVLFLGAFVLSFMAIMCYLAEGSFVGARPYAAAANTLLFLAMAVK